MHSVNVTFFLSVLKVLYYYKCIALIYHINIIVEVVKTCERFFPSFSDNTARIRGKKFFLKCKSPRPLSVLMRINISVHILAPEFCAPVT